MRASVRRVLWKRFKREAAAIVASFNSRKPAARDAVGEIGKRMPALTREYAHLGIQRPWHPDRAGIVELNCGREHARVAADGVHGLLQAVRAKGFVLPDKLRRITWAGVEICVAPSFKASNATTRVSGRTRVLRSAPTREPAFRVLRRWSPVEIVGRKRKRAKTTVNGAHRVRAVDKVSVFQAPLRPSIFA